MLPTTLLNSLKNLTKKIEIDKEERVVSYFERYYKNEKLKFIYVGTVMRALSIDVESSYILLNALVKEGFLNKIYQFRCPNDAYKQLFFEDFINLPIHVTCDECFDEFVLRDHLFVIYEVNRDV